MKVKLLCTLLFFISQCNYSQTIKGKVIFNNYAIADVEVINANTKTLTSSDANGKFSIAVKTNDVLVFVSKGYEVKQIAINSETITKNNLTIELILKAEELNEVVITKMPSINLSLDENYEQGKLDKLALEKSTRSLKTGVYNGSIENGMDLMRIGGMILGLFRKEKETAAKTVPKIEFKARAATEYNQKFYVESLKLKPEQIPLFLEFCDADPKSKTVSESSNGLALMDFLFSKNTEFKKLTPVAR